MYVLIDQNWTFVIINKNTLVLQKCVYLYLPLIRFRVLKRIRYNTIQYAYTSFLILELSHQLSENSKAVINKNKRHYFVVTVITQSLTCIRETACRGFDLLSSVGVSTKILVCQVTDTRSSSKTTVTCTTINH